MSVSSEAHQPVKGSRQREKPGRKEEAEKVGMVVEVRRGDGLFLLRSGGYIICVCGGGAL